MQCGADGVLGNPQPYAAPPCGRRGPAVWTPWECPGPGAARAGPAGAL